MEGTGYETRQTSTLYCFGFNVETYHHVTLTLHTVNKMAEDTDALFIFGNDLEAILDALEEDEGVHEEFSAAVSNV